jgi:hypothetical protein
MAASPLGDRERAAAQLKVAQLREELKQRGLATWGRKADLVKRLTEVLTEAMESGGSGGGAGAAGGAAGGAAAVRAAKSNVRAAKSEGARRTAHLYKTSEQREQAPGEVVSNEETELEPWEDGTSDENGTSDEDSTSDRERASSHLKVAQLSSSSEGLARLGARRIWRSG